MKPKISVIVCTYNGESFLENCLDSILSQSFKNFEVLCVDGMSSDNTQKIIKKYEKKDKRIKFSLNKNRLPEGKGNGKWLGYKNSVGDLIAIIDQDNVIQRKDLFEKVVSLFEKETDIIGILGGLSYDKKDSPVTRYVSLAGTDSFFAYRSVDFLRNLNKFGDTSLDYEKRILNEENMPLTGGNCFFYSKKDLELIGGYDKDVSNIKNLIRKKKNYLFIIKNATKHYAGKNLAKLIVKKFSWGLSYRKNLSFNYFPTTNLEKTLFIKNILFNITVFPNFIYSIKLFQKTNDFVSFLFPIFAFFNTLAYAVTFLKNLIWAPNLINKNLFLYL